MRSYLFLLLAQSMDLFVWCIHPGGAPLLLPGQLPCVKCSHCAVTWHCHNYCLHNPPQRAMLPSPLIARRDGSSGNKVCVCVYAHTFEHVEAPGNVVSRDSSTLVFETISHWPAVHPLGLADCPASPRNAPVSVSLEPRPQAQLLYLVPGDWVRVLILPWQALSWLNHLYSTARCFRGWKRSSVGRMLS